MAPLEKQLWVVVDTGTPAVFRPPEVVGGVLRALTDWLKTSPARADTTNTKRRSKRGDRMSSSPSMLTREQERLQSRPHDVEWRYSRYGVVGVSASGLPTLRGSRPRLRDESAATWID